MSKEIENEDLEQVKKCAIALGEHFDAVQIFATRQESSLGGAVKVSFGVGNFFARYGHVIEWKIKQEEYTRLEARKDYEE